MRKQSVTLCVLLLAGSIFGALGQTATDSPKPADRNATVGVKALFRNERGEILLVFDDRRQAWEVPGASQEGQLTARKLVDAIASDVGINYEDYRLGGLFTYHNPQGTIVRPYYMARFRDYIDGKGFKDGGKTKWFGLAEAKKAIPYPASILIIDKLVSEPERVWGGAFEEYGYTSPMTDRGAIKFRIIENFHPLK